MTLTISLVMNYCAYQTDILLGYWRWRSHSLWAD